MEYKKYCNTVYIRMDRGDEIIGCIRKVCGNEKILSAVFSGIGGCSEAQIQTFVPETGTFETQTLRGMLELVSLTGNVISGDDQDLYHHLLKLAEQYLGREFVEEQIRTVAPSLTEHSNDEALFARVRERIGDALEVAMN